MEFTTSSLPAAGVIGAGIAGLSAAIALRRSGWDVEIFEKSSLKNETGAAITLMATTVATLDEWGLDFQKAQGVPNQRMTIVNATDLGILAHAEYPKSSEEQGYESLTFHRADLHRCLLDLATGSGAKPARHGTLVRLRSSCEVGSIDCDQGILTLASGETISKDLLVIADGAHSQLHSQFSGHSDEISRIGRSLYRILLDREKVDAIPGAARFLNDSPTALPGFCCAIDPVNNTLMVAYPCRNQTLLNIAIVHNTKVSPSTNEDAAISWQAPSSVAETLKTLHNFHPDLQKMIECAADDSIKIHHGMHRPAMNSFARGKAIITGDAAHLMLPTHAAGGSIAIENAAVLEILMRGVADPAPSFAPTPVSGSPVPSTPVMESLQSPPTRPACSTSSSTRDLLVGIPNIGTITESQSTPSINLAPPTLPGVIVTNAEMDDSRADLPGDKPADFVEAEVAPTTLSPVKSLTSSLVSRALTLFNSLRVPRCTAFQLLSNGGFMSQADPKIVEQIRRHGFQGDLPSPTAGPWDDEFRAWYFAHDARKAAEEAMMNLAPRDSPM